MIHGAREGVKLGKKDTYPSVRVMVRLSLCVCVSEDEEGKPVWVSTQVCEDA